VLKLINDNIKAGDKLVQTGINGDYWGDIAVQGFITGSGKKVLIINKRDKTFMVKLPPGFKGGEISTVDEDSGDNAATQSVITADSIQIKPFAVSLIKLK
jgi:cell shape-determining protein MreC